MQANANTKFNWANQGETHNAVCNALGWLRYSSWIIKCVNHHPHSASRPFLTIRLRLRRDLRAWTEAAGDLDTYVEVEGYRNVIMSHIKKLDDDSKLALSLCESPAQVVRVCCT